MGTKVPQRTPSSYGNRRRDPRTGRFVGRFASLRNLRRLAELTGEEWDIEEAALTILEGGIALAIQDGWIPPAGAEVSS